ncbi:G-protein coupled receptor GRL101-like [Mytilus californianus]|uniref:G-protein coupled receptor GRL101-like n=1 Tax=Mytilus californianus TaxID=6549 RepID=UPI0022485233|nr:G-protein coupled receptor GRL101-like [Mytilus californianus]
MQFDISPHQLPDNKIRNLTCPGLYRCQQSTTCLLFDEVCDNIRQCPHGDDEIGCDVTCPSGCSCEGFVFICHQKEVETVFMDLSVEARKLDLSSSVFPNNNLIVPAYTYLAELNLFNCSIANIMPYSFEQLMNLLHLDLSSNKIKVLDSYTFYGLTKLVTLNLKNNLMLGLIKPYTFMSLPNVKGLELSGTRIKKLFDGTFNGLENLETLIITGNGLTNVEKKGFDGLVSLMIIDLTGNDVTEFSLDIFSRLSHLTEIKTDSYIFCCLKPESVFADKCYPKMDEFSSCSDLMRNDVLRVCLWIIAVNALIGNIGVILYRIIYEKALLFKANGLFIMNLGVSDMLMGVYLGIIAVADMFYSGNYILHDRKWRDSLVCKFAGIIAAISCEASVNFIMLTTLDCYLMVKSPFGRRRMTYKTAKISTFVCWVFVIIIAVVPIFNTSYFSNTFYSRTAVCLALPFSRQKVSGWEYSTAVFVFYNSIAFTVIAWCQFSIYNVAKSSNRIMAKRTKQDLTLARRLFLIVLTDFLCWFPVGIMGMLAMTGQVFPPETYSWVAVFVMPLNAALNPFLYTFSTIKQEVGLTDSKFSNTLQKKTLQITTVKLLTNY